MHAILTLLLTFQLSPVRTAGDQFAAIPGSSTGIMQIEDISDLLEPVRVEAGLPALAALVIERGEILALGKGLTRRGRQLEIRRFGGDAVVVG